jgi:hypothetical protein
MLSRRCSSAAARLVFQGHSKATSDYLSSLKWIRDLANVLSLEIELH